MTYCVQRFHHILLNLKEISLTSSTGICIQLSQEESVRKRCQAAFEAALHDTLDLTPDQVEALYQAFLQKLPDPLRDRIDGLQKSSPDQKARKAA